MSIPILIVGGTSEQRRAEIDLKPNPDLLVLEPEKSIGIKEIRFLEKFLMRKPYQKDVKTAVINQAEKMTLAAQQAILKTLEEPPAHSQIILLLPHENLLLETIVSRCRIKKLADADLNPSQMTEQKKIFERLNKAKTLERFAIVATFSSSQEAAKDFISAQLKFMREGLITHPETVKIALVAALQKTLSALSANVNPKLTLEVLALSY
jgi:DNA polymerase III gamma/tau subunit